MGWPKGKPRSTKDKVAISAGLNGDTSKLLLITCSVCGKEFHRYRTQMKNPDPQKNGCSQECATIIGWPEKIKRAQDPKWKQKVSEGTKRGQTPEGRVISSRNLKHCEKVTEISRQKISKKLMKRKLSDSHREKVKLNLNGPHVHQDEKLFYKTLRSVLIPLGFVSEKYIGGSTKSSPPGFRVDFVHLEGKVIVECDGFYHRSTDVQEKDKIKDARAKSLSYRVVRVKEWSL